MGLTPQPFPPQLTSSASAVAEWSAHSVRSLLPLDAVPIPQENGHAPFVGQDSGSHIAKCQMRKGRRSPHRLAEQSHRKCESQPRLDPPNGRLLEDAQPSGCPNHSLSANLRTPCRSVSNPPVGPVPNGCPRDYSPGS